RPRRRSSHRGRRGYASDGAAVAAATRLRAMKSPKSINHRCRRENPHTGCKGEGQNPPFCFCRAVLRPICSANLFGRIRSASACRGRRYGLSRRDAVISPVTHRQEPIFNVPPVVVATVAVLLFIHALRLWVFTE